MSLQCAQTFLALQLLYHYYNNAFGIYDAIYILRAVSNGLISILLVSTVLELVCAQAPYNMRGLFGSWIALIVGSSLFLEYSVPHVPLAVYGVNVGLSLLGFILYCLLARWYTMRVRDEEYNVHRVVEEVYDRYLTARK